MEKNKYFQEEGWKGVSEV